MLFFTIVTINSIVIVFMYFVTNSLFEKIATDAHKNTMTTIKPKIVKAFTSLVFNLELLARNIFINDLFVTLD